MPSRVFFRGGCGISRRAAILLTGLALGSALGVAIWAADVLGCGLEGGQSALRDELLWKRGAD